MTQDMVSMSTSTLTKNDNFQVNQNGIFEPRQKKSFLNLHSNLNKSSSFLNGRARIFN